MESGVPFGMSTLLHGLQEDQAVAQRGCLRPSLVSAIIISNLNFNVNAVCNR